MPPKKQVASTYHHKIFQAVDVIVFFVFNVILKNILKNKNFSLKNCPVLLVYNFSFFNFTRTPLSTSLFSGSLLFSLSVEVDTDSLEVSFQK